MFYLEWPSCQHLGSTWLLPGLHLEGRLLGRGAPARGGGESCWVTLDESPASSTWLGFPDRGGTSLFKKARSRESLGNSQDRDSLLGLHLHIQPPSGWFGQRPLPSPHRNACSLTVILEFELCPQPPLPAHSRSSGMLPRVLQAPHVRPYPGPWFTLQ